MDDNQNPNPWQTPATRDPQAQPEPRQTDGYRQPSFDAAIDVCRGLWRDYRSTLLTTWGTFSAVWLVCTLVTALGTVALGADPASQQEMMQSAPGGPDPFAVFNVMGPSYWVLVAVSVVIGYVLVGVGIATLGPIRRAWLEGRNLSTAEVVGEIGRRVFSGALLYLVFSILFTIGAVLCIIPGLVVAYFMMPTFYLVGGRGDGLFDSISTGFEWGKQYVALFFILIAVCFAVFLAMACVGGVSAQLMMSMSGFGYVASQILSWLSGTIFAFFIWLYYAGTMISIDQAEQQTRGW